MLRLPAVAGGRRATGALATGAGKHAYRDSIVRDDSERAVAHAAILYFGPPVRFGEEVSAMRTDPEAPEELARMIEQQLCEHTLT